MPGKDIFKTGEGLHGSVTLAGGAASEAETVRGVSPLDTVIATVKSVTNAVYLKAVVPTADTLTFTFSADPGASVVYYVVIPAQV